jgi:hypothetical protein
MVEAADLRTNSLGALNQIIDGSDYAPLIQRFGEAYEYRKQFPWLGESGSLPGERNKNGLAYALRQSLELYIVPNKPHILPKAPEFPIDVSDELRGQLRGAAGAVLDDSFSLAVFARALSRAGVATDSLSFDDLKVHIASALDIYSEKSHRGTSPDPW